MSLSHLLGRVRCLKGFGGENLTERDQLEDLGVDGSIILKWIFKKLDGGLDWVDLAQVAWAYECGNDPSISVKYRESLG
jgi:hypothetical protein